MANKEVKELMVGVLKLSALMLETFKDGVQVADFAVIMAKMEANPALKKAIIDMYQGVENVPSEFKEMKLAEYVDIIAAVLPEIAPIIEAAKKPVAAV